MGLLRIMNTSMINIVSIIDIIGIVIIVITINVNVSMIVMSIIVLVGLFLVHFYYQKMVNIEYIYDL